MEISLNEELPMYLDNDPGYYDDPHFYTEFNSFFDDNIYNYDLNYFENIDGIHQSGLPEWYNAENGYSDVNSEVNNEVNSDVSSEYSLEGPNDIEEELSEDEIYYRENKAREENDYKDDLVNYFLSNTSGDKKTTKHKCVICLENERILAYPECKHLCICISCFSNMDEIAKCPICREDRQIPTCNYDINEILIP